MPHGPGHVSHASGTLEAANGILAAHPDLARNDVYAAAVLGDDEAIRRFLAGDPAAATRRGGQHGWDPLTYLCFSRYLRLDPARSAGLVRTARVLLDAGADPGTGFFELEHQPAPEYESVLYGAAGVAHHEELTRLLLERGAEPNDEEVPYHAPETYDNGALRALLETGRLTAESLGTMLLRKADWHDLDGMALVLKHGGDPNLKGRWGATTLHHALRRDNRIAIIELLLDHGADPQIARDADGRAAAAIAARRGRADVLGLLERRGVAVELAGVERLIAACARGGGAARRIAAAEPGLAAELLAQGGTLLAEFAGNGNVEGVRCLLDLGVAAAAPSPQGDGYFGIPEGSTALHVAAWRAQHRVVRLLIERGAPLDAPDRDGATPLALAVNACVDSWWKDRRAPDSVAALLGAGASAAGVPFPCGYAAVDDLLQAHQERA